MKRATTAVNFIPTQAGTVSAVCECCGRVSRPVPADDDGEPVEWRLGRGWSVAPFPADSVHHDGSRGTKYRCPECNRRLRAGQQLMLRAYLPMADRRFRFIRKVS